MRLVSVSSQRLRESASESLANVNVSIQDDLDRSDHFLLGAAFWDVPRRTCFKRAGRELFFRQQAYHQNPTFSGALFEVRQQVQPTAFGRGNTEQDHVKIYGGAKLEGVSHFRLSIDRGVKVFCDDLSEAYGENWKAANDKKGENLFIPRVSWKKYHCDPRYPTARSWETGMFGATRGVGGFTRLQARLRVVAASRKLSKRTGLTM